MLQVKIVKNQENTISDLGWFITDFFQDLTGNKISLIAALRLVKMEGICEDIFREA